MLHNFVVLTQMRDFIELALHVILWNNTKCNILMVWCGPLHLAFLCNVAHACTNIQQVAEEEEGTPHVDTWHNARVWVDIFGNLHQ